MHGQHQELIPTLDQIVSPEDGTDEGSGTSTGKPKEQRVVVLLATRVFSNECTSIPDV
jgi:hypothetical protein